MTDITSKVSRRSTLPFARYGPDNKRIVATLHTIGGQGDFLTLRLERRRTGYSIDLCDLYAYLVRQKAQHKHLAKARGRRKVARKFARLTG